MATITGSTSAGSFTITPDEFPGWSDTSATNNIVHPFIGGGIGVTLIPIAPSTGTAELRFFALSDANTARDALRGMVGSGTMTSDESPAASGIDFIISGNITRTADTSSDQPMWVVSFDYQALT